MALDFAWKSYSSKPMTEKRVKLNKDGTYKTDKSGNIQYGTHINAGAVAQNFAGNGMMLGYHLLDFSPQQPKAENIGNEIASGVKTKALDAMMMSGNLPLMALGTLGKFTSKAGFDLDASVAPELGFWNNAGNTVMSLVPGAKLLLRKGNAASKFDSDLLKGSLTFNRKSSADGLYNGAFAFGNGQAGEIVDNENIRRSIGDQQLQAALRDFAAAKDKSYIKAKEMMLNGGPDRVNNLMPWNKKGSVLLFSKKTISKLKVRRYQNGGDKILKHLFGGKTENSNLPNWLFFDEEKNLYVSDLYESSTKLEILQLKNYVKLNLPGWKVWQSLASQKRYFVLPEKEANRRDWEFVYNLNNSGSSGGQIHNGKTVEVDGKTLYLLLEPNSESTHVDANGQFYYYPEHLKFKEGGKVNVIPEGALHKNKHHLEEVSDKFDNGSITTKGIPVIVESEDGEVVLQAEVERQEIIFRLEVTKELEELAKEGTDDAAIKAGKLLVKEILYNTEDNTGEML